MLFLHELIRGFMLQRIQTVWLLLAIILGLAVLLTNPISNQVSGSSAVQVVMVAPVVLEVISLFSFKRRKKQILLNQVSIIINVLLIGLLVFELLKLSGEKIFSEKGIELFLIVLAIVCLLLANAKIRKDEKLVKSVDRFR